MRENARRRTLVEVGNKCRGGDGEGEMVIVIEKMMVDSLRGKENSLKAGGR